MLVIYCQGIHHLRLTTWLVYQEFLSNRSARSPVYQKLASTMGCTIKQHIKGTIALIFIFKNLDTLLKILCHPVSIYIVGDYLSVNL